MGINPQKTPKGYYMYVMKNCKLYIYPEATGATMMVIPTSRKYNIARNMNIEIEGLGVMMIEVNPNRSNPALLYGLSENNLSIETINKVTGYMTNSVENIFEKCERLR